MLGLGSHMTKYYEFLKYSNNCMFQYELHSLNTCVVIMLAALISGLFSCS